MNKNKLLRWYCFTFLYVENNAENYVDNCIGIPIDDSYLITTEKIKSIKRQFNCPENSIMLNMAFLGEGTEEQFNKRD